LIKYSILFVVGVGLATALFAAPAPPAQPASNTQPPAAAPMAGNVVAGVGPAQLTREALNRALLESHGLNIAINLVQLEIAKQNALRAGVTVTSADIAREREQTLDKTFEQSNEKLKDKVSDAVNRNDNAEAERLRAEMKTDNERGMAQYLTEQNISRAEFDIFIETNAYLHKLAEPMLAGKISDEQLRDAFGALYGENLKCRHIQLANLQEVQEAKRRLAAGEPFAKVAQDMSRHPVSGPLGGELPPFSMQMQGFPQAFRDAAFALKEGQVSEVVQADGAFHLILLEKRIPPKVVKFEDVKQTLRTQLEARAMDAALKELRQQLADQAVAGITFNDPVLKKQWEERLAKREAEVKDRDQIRRNLEKQRVPTTAATQRGASDLLRGR
jgi:parvulin-like peptidyl-prolyl isomerase